MKIDLIYRCCEMDSKQAFRPSWFSKLKCLDNLLDVFKYNPIKGVQVNLHAIHDGAGGQLLEFLNLHDIFTQKINVRSNERSLETCLDYAAALPETDIIYFVEDDYLHTKDALEVLYEGFQISVESDIISLYDHTDRYFRKDDIDHGQTFLYLGLKRYWRTAESTTCTWAIKQSTFLNKGVLEAARTFKLNDREFFRSLRPKGITLLTPMHAASTHCHLPFLSPFVEWDKV